MKSQNPTPGKSGGRTRVTFVIFGLTILAAVCSYGYSVYAESQRFEALKPRLKLSSLIRDVRKYETVAGRVPKGFEEIEELVWKHKGRKPAFDLGGAAYTLGNYFYLYHALDERSATVWAVPLGERREEASTHFVIIGPDAVAHWKGAAIKLDDFSRISTNPQVSELASLGLVRQPDEVNKSKKKAEKHLRTPSTRASR